MSLSHISKFVLWGSVGFICGIGIGSFLDISIDVSFFILSIFAIIMIFIFYKKQWIWCFVFFVILFCCGSYLISQTLNITNILKDDVGQVLYGRAVVSRDIVQKGWSSDVVFTYDKDKTVLIKNEKYTELKWGSVVNLKCVTGEIVEFNDFDYQKYLFMNGVEYICDDFEYEVIGFESSVLSKLSIFRQTMENVVNNIIPSPQSALANGLLFGGDDRLSKQLQDKFAAVGMTHIVAVSGYNVSVIVAVVMGVVIFAGVRRQHAVIFAIIAILFFVALIGFPSSGVRAAIMGSMILIAASYGRVAHAYGAIFFTGAVMITFNPLLLRYDVGFQLSFLATLGIVAVYPVLEKYFVLKNKAFGIIEILLLTVSAQIFVLPVIAYHFHTFSIVSLLANVLVLPIIPITMLAVFFTVIFSVIFYPLALIFGWIAYFLLFYEIFVIDVLSRITWSNVQIEEIGILWFILYYVVVGSVVYLINKKMSYEI